MKTKISKENPFGLDAKGYLWQYFANNGPSPVHLDYGAHDAHMLVKLANSGMITKGIGVDLNSVSVTNAQAFLPPEVTLLAIKKNPKLPFGDDYFDSTSIVGVLEHIKDQDYIIEELKRVTKPGGKIMVAVPGKNLLSFLDMGNWKFVFPRTHKFFYVLLRSEKEYTARYTANKDGLIGDIEAEKSWHEHFSPKQLEGLLQRNGLIIEETDGFGFFFRIFVNLRFFLPGSAKRLMDPLIKLDSKLFDSAEIWTMTTKPSANTWP